VSLGRRYLTAVGLVAAGAGAVVLMLPGPSRGPAGWGAAVGLILQAPLGWWAVRSIGTDRFMPVWGLGMLVRFTVVLLAGFIVMPVLGAKSGAMLGAMVAVLVALLFVEAATALREHSREPSGEGDG
jgi:heme A synthase